MNWMLFSIKNKKRPKKLYDAKLIFDHLQLFLVQPFFDQVPNKGFALLAAGQFGTRLQELGLRGS